MIDQDNQKMVMTFITFYFIQKSFDVLYVDYGNMEKVSVDAIRWLSEKAAAYPAEVVYCSLYGVAPLTGSSTVSILYITCYLLSTHMHVIVYGNKKSMVKSKSSSDFL